MHESMFETFLKTAHQNDKKAADERTLVEAMKKLPPEVLFKLASGEAKLGSSYLKACSPGGCEGMEWVEQFKDTPLFEQALQLEQQAIQLEQMEQQYRAQRDAEREQEPKFWEMQDRIRLQKRLLGLQLAAGQLQQAGATVTSVPPGPAAPPPSATEAAGGGAPSPTDGKVAFDRAALLGQRMAHGDYERAVTTNLAAELGRSLAKTAFAVTDAGHAFDAADYGAQRDAVGARREARKDYRSAAPGMHGAHTAGEILGLAGGAAPVMGLSGPGLVSDVADMLRERHLNYAADRHAEGHNAYNPLGGLLTPTSRETKTKEKKALDAGALAGLGQQAMGFLRKNPGAALGAAAGAAGGLAHGLQKDQQGQRHLLSGLAQGAAGAAGGALAGHAAQNIGGAMRGGASLGQAAKGYGQQLQQAGGQAVARVQGALKPAASAAPAASAPAAAPAAGVAATRGALAPTLPMNQGRVAPTLPDAARNPSLMGATNQALNFQRAPADVQAAVRSNPLVASGQIGPEQAHQLMSWSAKGGVTPQAIGQMNSKTPRPAGFVDPREAATRVGG